MKTLLLYDFEGDPMMRIEKKAVPMGQPFLLYVKRDYFPNTERGIFARWIEAFFELCIE